MLRARTAICFSTSHPRLFARFNSSKHENYTASSQLWADAIKEEGSLEIPKPSTHPNEHPNWTGEESVQDAVLRMLVDKYKPLRGGSIRTAEEKLKSMSGMQLLEPRRNPLPTASTSASETADMHKPSMASISASEIADTHKPWLTTFRAPSHATSIRYMRLPPVPSTKVGAQGPAVHPDDSRTRILEREKKKKAAYVGRLTNARESSLDYRIGKTIATPADYRLHRPNPVSVKGWTSLVEERIERARSEGHFRSIKGRGKPIARGSEQSNPFIPREEFLMNRIVQRQGAAPPWVEFQGELETAVNTFRGILRSAWTKRAARTLTLGHPPGLLVRFTLLDVTSPRIRDFEWEAQEKGYHEAALREINALVRKYNGVAPYAVRRTYLTREAELDRMYEESGEDILAEIRRRYEVNPAGTGVAMGSGSDGGSDGDLGQGNSNESKAKPIKFGLKAMWERWVAKFVGG